MATARKDFRGRVLRKGEVQRASDKRYMYCYTDLSDGANTSTQMTL